MSRSPAAARSSDDDARTPAAAASEPAERTLDAGGPVHVVEWPGQGPPIVLVHGLGGSHLDWYEVAPAMAAAHRVAALDLPGFGRSPRAGRSSGVRANSDVLARVVAELNMAPATLVGNSMGGLVALLTAHRHPEAVERLVLVDAAVPAPLTARPDPIVMAGVLASSLPGLGGRLVGRRGRRLGAAGIVDQTLRMCCVDPRRVDPRRRQAFVDLALERRRTQPDGPEAYSQAARSLVSAVVGRVGRRAAHQVRIPALLVHGRRDRLVALGASQGLLRGHPERELAVIEDCGHIPMVELPDRFLEVVLPWLGQGGQAGS